MARKEKKKPSPRSSRSLGYMSVICLVAAALIIGAAHEPLKEWLGSFAQVNAPAEVALREESAPSDSGVREPHKPQHIEYQIVSQTSLTVLKVTLADSIRIEYVLVPASIGIDASHRQAMFEMVCALREAGPARRAIVFVGVGRFIDSAGQPALRSRVESKLSALALNRIKCAPGTDSRDIDWHKVAEYNIKFAVPPGLKVDL